jgi:hypothetical protein
MIVLAPWYQWTNMLSCIVMAGYLFFVCYVMPSRGLWFKRLVVWSVTATLALHVAAPWTATLPDVAWYTSLLHAAMSVALLAWHKHVVKFVVSEFLIYQNLETGHGPLADGSVWDGVHHVFLRNRRRVLRRFRDKQIEGDPPQPEK